MPGRILSIFRPRQEVLQPRGASSGSDSAEARIYRPWRERGLRRFRPKTRSPRELSLPGSDLSDSTADREASTAEAAADRRAVWDLQIRRCIGADAILPPPVVPTSSARRSSTGPSRPRRTRPSSGPTSAFGNKWATHRPPLNGRTDNAIKEPLELHAQAEVPGPDAGSDLIDFQTRQEVLQPESASSGSDVSEARIYRPVARTGAAEVRPEDPSPREPLLPGCDLSDSTADAASTAEAAAMRRAVWDPVGDAGGRWQGMIRAEVRSYMSGLGQSMSAVPESVSSAVMRRIAMGIGRMEG
ncbi:uncharacterized protein A4U43_C01F1420 [Asparagus officinalis]|uniref:Uncharacterized protein n=1 Tax=Asparagus officinalis TaxID=4686 RepID=A0A5P1FL58_ASPOF|nr:uncharacterized protein A4U43_C01F1420 [Asparagus officinalis]